MSTALMGNASKIQVKLTYNGTDCTDDFSKYLRSVVLREFENEQSDELNIILNNNDGYFSNLWYPEKNAKLTCIITNGTESFNCGTFTIDENLFDYTIDGDLVEIKALAASVDFGVRTNKIKNYSGKTLAKIAEEIGELYGFTVLGGSGNILTSSVIQKNESDMSFLSRIAREYGYIFNIKDGYLTFINIEDLENTDSLFTLNKEDVNNLELKDSSAKVYGKCLLQYYDLKTKTLQSYTAEGNTQLRDTLKLYKRCDSPEEAKAFAQSALNNTNREVQGRIKLFEAPNSFTAGVNFNLAGFGKFDGKYHIKSQTRKADKYGYSAEGEIVKI